VRVLDLPGAAGSHSTLELGREATDDARSTVRARHRMRREETFAIVVLVGLALFVVFTAFSRLHDGRCRPTTGGRRGAVDCGYPVGTFPNSH